MGFCYMCRAHHHGQFLVPLPVGRADRATLVSVCRLCLRPEHRSSCVFAISMELAALARCHEPINLQTISAVGSDRSS